MSENTTEQLTDYPELLTVEEVAGLLNTDVPSVLGLTATGTLRAIEIGSWIRRYLRADVQNYLHKISAETTPTVG